MTSTFLHTHQNFLLRETICEIPSESFQGTRLDWSTTSGNQGNREKSQVGTTKKRLASEIREQGLNHDRVVASVIEKIGHIEVSFLRTSCLLLVTNAGVENEDSPQDYVSKLGPFYYGLGHIMMDCARIHQCDVSNISSSSNGDENIGGNELSDFVP